MEEQPQIHSRRSYVYESHGNKKNRKKMFAIIGGAIIVLLVIIIASFAFSGDDAAQDEDLFATPAITQAPTDTPTPSPRDSEEDTEETENPKLDREDYTILIKNGSGTAGVAGRLADILGDLGYKIGGTENADNFEYEETEIHVASGNNALLKMLEDDLSDEYSIGETNADYDGLDDAVIIIGAE